MSKKVINYINRHGGLLLEEGNQTVIARETDEYDRFDSMCRYTISIFNSPEDDDSVRWGATDIGSLVYFMRMYEPDLRKWGGLQCS